MFWAIFDLLFANVFNLGKPKIVSSVKGLKLAENEYEMVKNGWK